LQSTERAKEDIKSALQALNTHLLPRTYLVGERITLADIGVACTLLQLYQYVLDTNFRLVCLLLIEVGLHVCFVFCTKSVYSEYAVGVFSFAAGQETPLKFL
jgi:hypothetical protein